MTLLLPGVSVTYNGEEIGMENTWISWEDTKDPQGCNAGKEGYEKVSRDPARTPFQWDNTTSAGRYRFEQLLKSYVNPPANETRFNLVIIYSTRNTQSLRWFVETNPETNNDKI